MLNGKNKLNDAELRGVVGGALTAAEKEEIDDIAYRLYCRDIISLDDYEDFQERLFDEQYGGSLPGYIDGLDSGIWHDVQKLFHELNDD